jgi:hypothetical protein
VAIILSWSSMETFSQPGNCTQQPIAVLTGVAPTRWLTMVCRQQGSRVHSEEVGDPQRLQSQVSLSAFN